jgi:hypothetical protein
MPEPDASDSMPFIKMTRTRVNASSFNLLCGDCTSCFQVNVCL